MNTKILSIAVVLIAAPTMSALAGEGSGCGVGTMIFKGQSGLFPNVLAITTNGTLGNQTFGLTSGTLGCDSTKVVENDYERRTFVASNLDNLSQDMAQGNGEHLAVLASLMGVAAEDQARFFQLTQAQYGRLFQSSATTSNEVLASLDQALTGDAQLAKYVR